MGNQTGELPKGGGKQWPAYCICSAEDVVRVGLCPLLIGECLCTFSGQFLDFRIAQWLQVIGKCRSWTFSSRPKSSRHTFSFLCGQTEFWLIHLFQFWTFNTLRCIHEFNLHVIFVLSSLVCKVNLVWGWSYSHFCFFVWATKLIYYLPQTSAVCKLHETQTNPVSSIKN